MTIDEIDNLDVINIPVKPATIILSYNSSRNIDISSVPSISVVMCDNGDSYLFYSSNPIGAHINDNMYIDYKVNKMYLKICRFFGAASSKVVRSMIAKEDIIVARLETSSHMRYKLWDRMNTACRSYT